MTISQSEIWAQGLSRTQEQLADLIPLDTQKALVDRALTMQPTLARLRQLVTVHARMGNLAAARSLLDQIPRFQWSQIGPDSSWHDDMRAQLNGPNLAAPGDPSDRLVIAFAFPPFANASGNVMARRIEAMGRRVDVISNDMSGRELLDRSLYGAISPLIGQHLVLDCENWPARSAPFADFADKTVAALASGRFGRSSYPEVYSRAMWAQSHFAAAALLAAGRADSWVAEFSDPCRVNLNGQQDGALADDAWLESSGIAALLRQRGHAVPTQRTLMFWAEYLAFCLADRITFTNAAQRDLMVSQAEDPPEIRARAAAISEVIPQPTPGSQIMAALPMPKPVRGPIWIGFFGNANPRRGLSGLLGALAQLPEPLRQKVRLHIHGKADPELRATTREMGIAGMVQIWPSLDYLDALARMRMMDWLFVNDTASTAEFETSPYLPSKLADYKAAGRAVLAFAEPGSPLSQAELPAGSIRVDMTDDNAVLDAIIRIASSGEQNLQSVTADGTWRANSMDGIDP